MKCYNHHDRDAFGTAFLSGKGLCLECMEEYQGIIIEKNDEIAKKVADKMLGSYSLIGSYKKDSFLKTLIIGIIFILFGILLYFDKHELNLLLFIGIFFIIFSFICIKRIDNFKK